MRARAHAKDSGVKKAMLLNVSAPFHCSLMRPAADAMAEALADVSIAQPVTELVANVSASAVTDPEALGEPEAEAGEAETGFAELRLELESTRELLEIRRRRPEFFFSSFAQHFLSNADLCPQTSRRRVLSAVRVPLELGGLST